MEITNVFFVVRAKTNIRFRVVKPHKVDKTTGLKCEQYIKPTGVKSKKHYPNKIRRVKYHDHGKQITLVFLTNNFDLEPLEITRIYRNR